MERKYFISLDTYAEGKGFILISKDGVVKNGKITVYDEFDRGGLVGEEVPEYQLLEIGKKHYDQLADTLNFGDVELHNELIDHVISWYEPCPVCGPECGGTDCGVGEVD